MRPAGKEAKTEHNAKRLKAQSAMEYLMTYGWSILILAVVIAALYYLGVFNTGSAQSNVCLGITGYTCQNPILYASGQLNVTLGQIGQAITVTNTYCTSNSAPPQNAGSGNLNIHVYQDQNAQIQFQCPLTSTAIGTQFSGYIWIVYNTGTQTGIVQEVGAVKASVIAGGSGPNSAYGYVPITITNSQSSPTGSDFQDMVTVDSATYGNYINSGWQNVEFTTGSQYSSGGTPIYAWVESNPSNTASSTIVWLLLPGGIAADSSATVYMNFMTNNVMTSGSSYTGEAPQLSPSYAEYDNGAEVFSFYDDFAGTTVNTNNWISYPNCGGMYPKINNGITISAGNSILSTKQFLPGNVIEVYASISSGAQASGCFHAGVGIASSISYTTGWATDLGTGYGLTEYPSSPQGVIFSTQPTSTSYYIWSTSWNSIGYLSSEYNYGNLITAGTVATASSGVWFVIQSGSATTISADWVRDREYPSNGVMPTFQFGAFTN